MKKANEITKSDMYEMEMIRMGFYEEMERLLLHKCDCECVCIKRKYI